jgi:hypothetical protein
MSIDPTQQQKDVEFYAAAVSAWLNTSLEHDKSVFALSAGGIGLLITLLTTVGVSNVVLLVLYVAAILAFLASLISVLAVFRRNRTHIEQVCLGNRAPDPLLTVLDQVAVATFGIGAILAAVIGISTAVSSYSTKERALASENKRYPTGEPLSKSFNGLGGLQQQPAGVASSPAPAPAPAPALAPTAEQPASGTGFISGSSGK